MHIQFLKTLKLALVAIAAGCLVQSCSSVNAGIVKEVVARRAPGAIGRHLILLPAKRCFFLEGPYLETLFKQTGSITSLLL